MFVWRLQPRSAVGAGVGTIAVNIASDRIGEATNGTAGSQEQNQSTLQHCESCGIQGLLKTRNMLGAKCCEKLVPPAMTSQV
mmetsp:Transcript_22297/g.42034  ORF Transcript_22297/g.42034 Transcript_22297/m.42034 type:complete len:82 (+) Transcript_22297:61-306(+)